MSAPFDGAVLAGGASRRMGTDKAFVAGPDGRPLVAVAVAALVAAGAGETFVVGGDARRARALGLEWRPDRHPGEGPLGGIVTALHAADHDLVVVMACDMPGVGPDVPATLVRALEDAPGAGVAVAVVGEREQPLTACWRRSVALATIEEAFASGERAPRWLLDRLGAVRVGGLDEAQLLDVDSPEDLRRYAEAPLRPLTPEQERP